MDLWTSLFLYSLSHSRIKRLDIHLDNPYHGECLPITTE